MRKQLSAKQTHVSNASLFFITSSICD